MDETSKHILHSLFDVSFVDTKNVTIRDSGWKEALNIIRENILKVINFYWTPPVSYVDFIKKETIMNPDYEFELRYGHPNSIQLDMEFYKKINEKINYQNIIKDIGMQIATDLKSVAIDKFYAIGKQNNLNADLIPHISKEWYDTLGLFNKVNYDFCDFCNAVSTRTRLRFNSGEEAIYTVLAPKNHGVNVEPGIRTTVVTIPDKLTKVLQFGEYFQMRLWESTKEDEDTIFSSFWNSVKELGNASYSVSSLSCASPTKTPNLINKDHVYSNRDIFVYDMTKHCYNRVSFLECIKNCFRFNKETGHLSDRHFDAFIEEDLFKFRDVNGNLHVAQTWIEVEEKYISEEVLNLVVTSIINYVEQKGFRNHDEMIVILEELFPTRSETTLNTGCRNITSMGRYMNMLDRVGGVRRIVMLMFLNSTISLNNMINMVKNNITIPIDFILCRPWMEFNSSTFLFFKNNEPLTRLNIKEIPNLQNIVKDVDKKLVIPELSVEVDVEVLRPEHIMAYEDVELFQRGGVSTQLIDLNMKIEAEMAEKSIIPMMIPVTETRSEEMIDLRGVNEKVIVKNMCTYYSNLFRKKERNNKNTLCCSGTYKTTLDHRYEGKFSLERLDDYIH